MRLLITPLAERDIEDIGDYIARDNPKRALTFVAELRAVSKNCLSAPDLPAP